jgi:hypothetical protein
MCLYTKDPQWYPFNKGNNLHSGTFQYWNVLAHGLPISWALHIYGTKLLRAHHASKPPLLHRVMPYCHGITVLVVWICLKPQRHFSKMYLKRTSKAWRKIIKGITLAHNSLVRICLLLREGMLFTALLELSVNSPCLWAFFHHYPLSQWHTQSNEIFQNLSMKISRLIIVVVLGEIICSNSGGAQEKGKQGWNSV